MYPERFLEDNISLWDKILPLTDKLSRPGTKLFRKRYTRNEIFITFSRKRCTQNEIRYTWNEILDTFSEIFLTINEKRCTFNGKRCTRNEIFRPIFRSRIKLFHSVYQVFRSGSYWKQILAWCRLKAGPPAASAFN